MRTFILPALLVSAVFARADDLDTFAIRRIADFEREIERLLPYHQRTETLRTDVRRIMEAHVRSIQRSGWYANVRSRVPWSKKTRREFSVLGKAYGERLAQDLIAVGTVPINTPEFDHKLSRVLMTLGEIRALVASYPGNEVARFLTGLATTVLPASLSLTGASLIVALLIHPGGVASSGAIHHDLPVILASAGLGFFATSLGLALWPTGRRSMIDVSVTEGREAGAARVLEKFRARLRESLSEDEKMRVHVGATNETPVEADLLDLLFRLGNARAACETWFESSPERPGEFEPRS